MNTETLWLCGRLSVVSPWDFVRVCRAAPGLGHVPANPDTVTPTAAATRLMALRLHYCCWRSQDWVDMGVTVELCISFRYHCSEIYSEQNVENTDRILLRVALNIKTWRKIYHNIYICDTVDYILITFPLTKALLDPQEQDSKLLTPVPASWEWSTTVNSPYIMILRPNMGAWQNSVSMVDDYTCVRFFFFLFYFIKVTEERNKNYIVIVVL